MTTTLERAPASRSEDDTRRPPDGPRAPLRPVDLAAVTAVLGLAGLLPLGDVVKALLVGVFVLAAPGAAIITWVRVPKYTRLAAVPSLSMAVTTLVTLVAMWSYRWNPTGILVLGALAVLGSSLVWYSRSGAWPVLREWPGAALSAARAVVRGPGLNASTILTAAGLVLWVGALPTLPGVEANYYGLIASGSGKLLVPAMLLVTVGFAWAVIAGRTGSAVFAVAAAIAVLRATTWLGTEVPLYDWTYKHLGVVRYIQEHGLIMPNGTDIYTQWPAFFVASAWFSEVTTLDPMTLAHVFAPLVHVLIAVIVYSAARMLGQPPLTALTAAFVAEVVNWVGQDYFAPQSWALVLAFGALALLLASRGAPRMAWLAVIPFAAIVPSHQLTPFWLVGAAGLLVIFRCARPWWAVLVMGLIVAGYLALNLEAVAPYGIFSGGNPVANAASNVEMMGVPAKFHTSYVCRALSAAVFVAALASAVWSLRTRRRFVLSRSIIAFCALGLLLAQGYGGEAIFRVYLYSLLGCALLIAPALTALLLRWKAGPLGRMLSGLTVAGLCAAALAGLFSFFALWPMIVQTRAQVEASDRILGVREPGTRFMMMAPNGMPTRGTANYAALTLADVGFDYPVDLENWDRLDTFPTAQDVGYLEWSASNRPHPTYVAFSPQARSRIEYYGYFSPGADVRFRHALARSGAWRLVWEYGESAVYEYVRDR